MEIFNIITMKNNAKYTQEDMEKCWEQAKYIYENDISEVQSFKQYLQSLQPTAKAVVVEMEEKDGIYSHKDCEVCGGDGGFKNSCSACGGHGSNMTTVSEYSCKIKVETSSEYSQGIVRAIEVIY